GMADEKAEREEAEGMRAREMALEEARLAAEMEVDEEREGEGEMEEGARDLDADVPDLDEEWEEGSWSEGEVGSVGSVDGGDGAFDDLGLSLGNGVEAEGEGDYAEPPLESTGTAGDGAAGRVFRTLSQFLPARGGGRAGLTPTGPVTPGNDMLDLDEGIPEAMEAGSYEHTDTELEDMSSDDVWVALPVSARNASARPARTGEGGFTTPETGGAGGRSVRWQGNVDGHSGGVWSGSGNFLGESVFGSSPIQDGVTGIQGRGGGGRGMESGHGSEGARRGTGRRVSARRGVGWEN
ncbi:MAG: hypothetical protein Q9217_006123, partial [Psora testacea]